MPINVTLYIVISVLFFTNTAAVVLAQSKTASKCNEAIQACFLADGSVRVDCFNKLQKRSICKNIPAEKLIAKRCEVSAGSGANGNNAPGLLGPSVYDQGCILNCDNQWLSLAISDDNSTESSERILSCYNSCAVDTSLEILRP